MPTIRSIFSILGLLLGALLLLSIRFDWVAKLRGPAPYPPEWQWLFDPKPLSLALAAPVLAGLGLVVLLLLSKSVSGRRAARRAGWLLGLASLLGLVFQFSLLGLLPGRPATRLLEKTFRPQTISYFNVAVSGVAERPLDFLDRQAQLLPEMRKYALHASTHPPGMVLYYRAVLGLFRAAPGWARRIVDGAPLDASDRRRLVARHGPVLVATALVGTSLLLLFCVLACWPIALLCRSLFGDRAGSLRVGILWLLLPGPALFYGSLDQALALPVMVACAGFAFALLGEGSSRKAAGLGLLSGLFAGLALQTSYGALFFLGLGGACVLAACAGRAGVWRRLPAVLGCGAASMAALFFGPTLLGHEPLEAFRTALSIHAEYYTAPRDYLLWLAHNPLDLMVFLGPPVALLLPARLLALCANFREECGRISNRILIVGLVCLAALQLSGTVRGEVGRLWIPLMPFLLVPAIHPGDRPMSSVPCALLGAALLLFTITLRLSWRV